MPAARPRAPEPARWPRRCCDGWRRRRSVRVCLREAPRCQGIGPGQIVKTRSLCCYHWYVVPARLVSVNANATREFRKLPRAEGRLIANYGLEGDRHAGRELRQVSLLNAETVDELAQAGMPVVPGVLGENIT